MPPRAWLAQGEHLVSELGVARRTGIEGWFDPPARQDEPSGRPLLHAPPRSQRVPRGTYLG